MDQSDAQVRLVADDGTLLKHDTYKVDLSDDELRDLYVKLVVVRRIDTEGTNLQRQGQLGIWAPCLGQEAAQVGSGCALAPGDFVFPSYREHGVAYVRSVDIMKILQLYRGVSLSGWDPHEKNFALYTIPIGTQALHAVGYAIGAKWGGADLAALLRLRVPGGAGGRQRRAGGAGGDQSGGGPGPRRRRPDPDRGGDLPARRPHHHRRPHPLPDRRRPGHVDGARADRPLPRLPREGRPVVGGAGPHRQGRGGRHRRQDPRRGRGDAVAAARGPGRPRLHRSARHVAAAVRAATAVRERVRRGGGLRNGADHHGQGAQRGAARRHGGRRQGRPPRRGRRHPRRCLPHHRRPAQGLRRAAGHGHPAGRVRHHRHLHRAGHPRLPPRARDAVRRLQLPRARPDLQPPGQVPEPVQGLPVHAGGRTHPLRRRHRLGRAPLREPGDALRSHRRAQGRGPVDAGSLLRESIEIDDPVIFLEPKRRYWAKQEIDLPIRTEPIGRANVLVQGDDCTLVAYGPMVKLALDDAQAAAEEGLGSLEVIDLRSLVPFDEDTVVASARKTGRMVVVHEAPEFLGFGAEVAARVTEAAFLHLEAPVLRCAGLDIPYPPAKLEEAHLPSVDRILWTVQRSLDY